MTRREIERALPFWRQILRVEDWDIGVRQGTAKELMLDGDPCEGLNYLHPEELVSRILLRRGATEETLVHELLHIVWDGDKDDYHYDVLHERALNRTAQALMRLKGVGMVDAP